MLFVKSQTYRTQLENKDEVVSKINELVAKALEKKKKDWNQKRRRVI